MSQYNRLVSLICFALSGLACWTPGACSAQSVAASGQDLRLSAGLESAYVLQGSPGEAYLVVDLAAVVPSAVVQRPSMAVALVIDRSGSMEGDKIVHARLAASSFLQNLADGDVVAIYQYDDVVEMVAPPTVVNAQSRLALVSAVQGVVPRGSTNLHGGLVAGLETLASPQAERAVRRVILISDGLANVGPSSPAELGQTAAIGASRGVAVTTIGVGLDYDETIMGTVAVRSGGRFYHLQQPAQLAAILESELQALTATVARSVMLELRPAAGVQVLGASGADLIRQGNLIRLQVGDMLGRQTRQVVLPVRVPTNGLGRNSVGELSLSYRRAATNEPHHQSASVSYDLTATPAQVTQGVRPEFAVAVETYRTAQAQQQAAQLVAEGEADRAAAVLEEQAARTQLRARTLGGGAGAALSRRAAGLSSRGQAVREARSAPAARAEQLRLQDEALDAVGY